MSWSIKIHPVKELASGHELTIKSYHFETGRPGPHVYLQASVHGAEVQGNLVLFELMNWINSQTLLKDCELRGSFTLVPMANPYATNHKAGTYSQGRFNPVTGHNWNRNYTDLTMGGTFKEFLSEHHTMEWPQLREHFKNWLFEETKVRYEKAQSDNLKLNLLLQHLASKADIVLDLHTGPNACRYLYVPQYAEEIAKTLLFEKQIIIPEEFAGAMDEASFYPWFTLYQETHQSTPLDFYAFTLELGSEETLKKEEAKVDVQRMVNFFNHLGLSDGEVKKVTGHKAPLAQFKTLYAPKGGLVDFHVNPGDIVSAGTNLASLFRFNELDPEAPAKSLFEMSLDSDIAIINTTPTGIVNEGMELIQYLENPIPINN